MSSGRVPCALATVSATPTVAEPQVGRDRPGLTVLTRTPRGPNSFDSDLQRLLSARLGGAVVDDQGSGRKALTELIVTM